MKIESTARRENITAAIGLSQYIRRQFHILDRCHKYLLILCLLSAFYYSWPILTGSYRRGWDAPTHIFFASGYLEDWWSVWDTRWYGGYSKTTYPPLTHQIVALITMLVGNIELAYGLVLWGLLTISPIAMYQFARVFVDQESSLMAAFLFVFAPTARIMLFTHGQFAGFAGLLFAMFAVRAVSTYIQKPNFLNGSRVAFLSACSLASHQATNIFFLIPAFCLAIYVQINLYRSQGIREITINIVLKPVLWFMIGVVISLPFITWLFDFQMQTPIPHPSRTNLLEDYNYFQIFFLDNYGVLLLLIPVTIWYSFYRKISIPVICSSVLFMVLGLGGTTQIPSLLFGPDWEWLTYERFNTWAIILFLPVGGYVLRKAAHQPFLTMRKFIIVLLCLLACWWLITPEQKSTTSPLIDMTHVYDSLNNDPLCRERYLALGFGHQLPRLSTHTSAKTLDGLWHTARNDLFLRNSGIGSLSDALYWENGGEVLKAFLNRHDLIPAYCIYINDMEPKAERLRTIVSSAGWHQQKSFPSHISLWRNNNLIEVGSTLNPKPSQQSDFSYVWGILPIIFLAGAVTTSSISVVRDTQNQ